MDTENHYYEHNKRREMFRVVDHDVYGRVVIQNVLGREFAVDQGVLDTFYTAVDETEAAPLFEE